ncbi:hypothetical protein ACTFIR_000852 [Dictyostelium discoideum]
MDDEDYRNSKQIFYWGRGVNQGGKHIIEPIEVPELNKKNIVQLSCGSTHTLVLSDSGDLYSWGSSNSSGQLGHGDSKNQYGKPKNIKKFSLIKALSGDSVIQVSTGLDFTFVLTDQVSIYNWGSNIEGQLALGQPVNKNEKENNNNNNNNTTNNNTNNNNNNNSNSNKGGGGGVVKGGKNILSPIPQPLDQFSSASSASLLIDSLTSTYSTRSYITLSNNNNIIKSI